MREHQVVINLKREQFEEVQRLARLAGSRSPSAFLRDRVLNLLGMEQAEHVQQRDAGIAKTSTDLNSVNQELARMHRELQVFIAESLSSGAYLFELESEQGGFEEPPPPYVEVERQLERAQEILSSYGRTPDTTTYGAPQTSHQGTPDPASSMASGSTENSQTASIAQPAENHQSTGGPSGSTPQTSFSGYGSTSFSSGSGTIGSRMSSFQNASKYSNLFSSGMFDTRQLSDSDVWMTPEIDDVPANSSLGLPPGVGTNEPVDQVSDELEELADRAFAISPRLGTTEEPRARTELRVPDDDPLRDLLDDTLVEHIQQPANDQSELSDESSSSVVYAAFPDEPVYGTQSAQEEVAADAHGSFRTDEAWGSDSLASQGFAEPSREAASSAASSSSTTIATGAATVTQETFADSAGSDTGVVSGSDTSAVAGPDTAGAAAASESAILAGSSNYSISASAETTAADDNSSFQNQLNEQSIDDESATAYTGDESASAPVRPPMDAPPPKRKKPATDSEDSHDVSGGPPPKRRRKPH